ncbi:MAG: hypothetical protein Q8K98_06280 [Bacteroidota bacterium]|nr:hypothetical protein [Bacteroidota bacterium]
MDIYHYGDRYLTHKDLLDLCKKLEIEDCNDNRLEFFEKRGLLLPVCRVIFNTEYIKYMNAIHYDPDNPFYGKNQFEYPDKWHPQYTLEKKIKDWKSSWFHSQVFHLLDKRIDKFKKFIRIPSCTRYRKWKDYDVIIHTSSMGDFKSNRAIHLYSYWQAYSIYEIVKASKIWLFLDLTDEKTIKALWNQKIPMKKVLVRSLPIGYNRADSILSKNNDFDALSFYIQSMIRLQNNISLLWKGDSTLIAEIRELALKRYQENEKRLARLTIIKYAFTEDRCIGFLKFLCIKYFEYQENKMDNLCDMLRNDIYHLTYLTSDGHGIAAEDIVKKVGRVTGHFKDTLHVIFPDELLEAKNNASNTMKSFLKSNLTIVTVLDVTDKDIENFLNYMIDHNLVIFFQTLEQLNKNLFSNKLFAQSGRQSNVINISLLLEVLLKTVARSSTDKNLVIYFSERRQLLDTLRGFYKSKPWWSLLCDNWKKLTDVTDTTDIADLLQDKIFKSNFHSTNSEWNSIIKMFLVCGVARNISAHEHPKLFHLSREVYQLIISQVLSALWFSWKYAEKEGLI